METKDRILNKALELFNEEGVKEVTLRQIAMALEMSQGNLNYHYKLKSDIISALYYQLVDEMDAEMEKIVKEQALLSMMYESSKVSMNILYNYRFLMKDLYSILQSDPELEKHYNGLQSLRKQQYLFLFNHMTEQGVLRKEELPGEYERFYERLHILGDHWVKVAEFFNSGKDEAVSYYHQLLFEVIYPYLTDKGKKEYLKLVQ